MRQDSSHLRHFFSFDIKRPINLHSVSQYLQATKITEGSTVSMQAPPGDAEIIFLTIRGVL
ncbi:MAG: hypothetical protein CVU57_01560 [Deltaproteobacteria bacterium HGW-Deltaproteobacteria-15]|nr:MAG: hypothetical protein CVU57_01560 [Deltaproteobacteria bacterium HGW-Deltaproteobacteria-15]